MTDRATCITSGQALELDGLSMRFGGGPGLSDVSLTVAAGERVVVLGPSGVGKTSLLRAVAGLARLDDGRIFVGANEVTDLPPERRHIVYLHQSPVLFSHLSVGENVAFPLRIRGLRGDAVDVRVDATLAAMQLTDLARRPTHSLSGGQRHRVALARASVARPAALLLDEPLSALDPTLRDDVRSAITASQSEYGPAMMLVTHDLDDAALMGDRIAVLLDGRIAQLATPATLFARPASLTVARFLGLYLEMPGRTRADGGIDCVLGVLPGTALMTVSQQSSQVIVAVRAGRVCIAPPNSGGARGRVVALRHRPRGTSVVVHLEDGPEVRVLEAWLSATYETPAVGDVISISVAPNDALIFPA